MSRPRSVAGGGSKPALHFVDAWTDARPRGAERRAFPRGLKLRQGHNKELLDLPAEEASIRGVVTNRAIASGER